MKKFIILITISFFLSLSNSYGQEIDWNSVPPIVRKNFFIALTMLDSCEKIIKINNAIIEKQDKIIKDDSVEMINKKNQIMILEQKKTELMSAIGNQMKVPAEEKRFLQWQGFFAGLGTGYIFGDTIISKSTFMKSLSDNIFITSKAIVKIKDDFLLIPSLDIPLNKDKRIALKFEFLYRLF
ncbi:MAG: hypothetical protein WC358_08320 [Ignavibacteria bacterium]|jgi:hypothetical protein